MLDSCPSPQQCLLCHPHLFKWEPRDEGNIWPSLSFLHCTFEGYPIYGDTAEKKAETGVILGH